MLTIVIAAIAYFLIGVVFPNPPASSGTQFAWRLGAWVLFAGVFAAHLAIEVFNFRRAPRVAALRVGSAMALGAFGIAAAANVHAFRSGTGISRLVALALVIWPLVAGIPAFLVAWAAGAILKSRTRSGGSA